MWHGNLRRLYASCCDAASRCDSDGDTYAASYGDSDPYAAPYSHYCPYRRHRRRWRHCC